MAVEPTISGTEPAGVRPPLRSSPSVVLFLALFASQAAILALAPTLSAVAEDFGVSLAVAGQLRILAAPLAAVAALAAGRLLTRYSPRALLVAGSGLVALGSVASAGAPTFALLALAQVPAWCGIATLLAAGIAAAASWSEPGGRARLVSHAFAGPPAAWIVGMPLIGVVASSNWRLAFVALPLPASLLALLGALARPADRPLGGGASSLRGLLARASTRRWALAELLATSAWVGTLVYGGALFTEVHGLSTGATGIALALVACAYLIGNRWAGRLDPATARRATTMSSIAAAAAVGLTWAFTPSVAVTVALFSAGAALAAARTVAGTVVGFSVAGESGGDVGTIRAATSQIGYLVGSLAGGLALAAGGFALLSVAFAGLFLVSNLPQVRTAGPAPAPSPSRA